MFLRSTSRRSYLSFYVNNKNMNFIFGSSSFQDFQDWIYIILAVVGSLTGIASLWWQTYKSKKENDLKVEEKNTFAAGELRDDQREWIRLQKEEIDMLRKNLIATQSHNRKIHIIAMALAQSQSTLLGKVSTILESKDSTKINELREVIKIYESDLLKASEELRTILD